MTTATTKLQLGTVALAMAATAAITPMVAQADTFAPLAPSLTSFSKALGNTAGSAVCDVTSGADCTAAVVAGANANATAGNSIFQNNIIWLGSQNPTFYNSPNTVEVWTFQPLNAIKWAEPLIPAVFAWFNAQESSSCFAGITTSLGGPYSAPGTYTHSYNHGGCDPSSPK